jgi:peptide/nickel transport system substrate-binding protein
MRQQGLTRVYVLLAAALLTVGPLASPAAPQTKLVLGSLEEPASLSALVDLPHHFPEHVPQTLLYDSLTQFMPDGTVRPKLAQKWEISKGGLVYTFTLAPDARFHDGTPVTAADVKFTFEAALNPDTKSSDEGLEAVENAEALDARTVRVTLKEVTP